MILWVFPLVVTSVLLQCSSVASHGGSDDGKSTSQQYSWDKNEFDDKSNKYGWREYRGIWSGITSPAGATIGHSHAPSIQQTSERLRKPLMQDTLGKPVYVTLTTIHNRLHGVGGTVESLVAGEVLPTHIYIFISQGAFLLDQGIQPDFLHSQVTHKLRSVYRRYPHISIIYTDNVGSHRKLLPLLADKWDEDCVIVTVDDHLVYPASTMTDLTHYYRASNGTAVVARRARRMGLCANAPPWKLSPYTRNKRGLWPETHPGRREMLMLPTGTGGVMYRPSFFHPLVFDDQLRNVTVTGDDLLFRLATLANGVPVVTACEDDSKFKCPPVKDLPHILGTQESESCALLAPLFPKSTFSHTPCTSHVTRQKEQNGGLRGERRRLPEMNSGGDTSSKEISLATIYNNVGGNNGMWNAAVAALREQGVLDFPSILQRVAPHERSQCTLLHSVIREGSSSNSWLHSSLVHVQNMYDRECGITTCP